MAWEVSDGTEAAALKAVLADVVVLLERDGPGLMAAADIPLPQEARMTAEIWARDLGRLSDRLTSDPDGARSWMVDHLAGAPQSLYEIFAGPFLSSVIAGRGASDERLDRALAELYRISRQIYFISINASVEANGAGSAGRAFAVIATEIRALSQEASAALSRISDAPVTKSQPGQTPLAKHTARA
ncbi:MAG: methyl-accepting chemotaxis protein [Pseudomonadota bacterium]